MSWVTMHAACYCCKQPFEFHPNKVPSIRVGGVREPVCRTCVERANPQRIANGLPPIEILPGAYEGADESEILWHDND